MLIQVHQQETGRGVDAERETSRRCDDGGVVAVLGAAAAVRRGKVRFPQLDRGVGETISLSLRDSAAAEAHGPVMVLQQKLIQRLQKSSCGHF